MIILDTNVLSALMQRAPDLDVVRWLDAQPSESIWLTSVTVFEVRYGIDLLPTGKRRRQLDDAFARALHEDFAGRVLSLDDTAAQHAGRLAARERRAGRTVEIRDIEIAAIVAARHGELATRNTKHFITTGIKLVDPWRS